MAEKRMFAKIIIDSDAFLDMPMSSQALYFHLSMRADDDGFVNNPRKIARMVGAADDDLRVLLTKNFLISFESGVIVIKHWRMHNTIQNDRYKKTPYTEELEQLNIKKNRSYTIKKGNGSRLDPERIQLGSSLDPQIRLDQIRLDQIRLDQIRLDQTNARARDGCVSGDLFAEFRRLYPKNNSCSTPDVEVLFHDRAKMDGAEAIFTGAEQYAEYCRWKFGDNQTVGWIKQAANFLRDFAYRRDWAEQLRAEKRHVANKKCTSQRESKNSGEYEQEIILPRIEPDEKN